MGYYSLLILYKQVWHCKWIHYYCTLERSVNLLCELEIKDLLLHAVYALLPVLFPRVFNVKAKCIRQHFCQVFLFYISALVAVAEEFLIPSCVCCLFISNTVFRQQYRYGTAFFSPSLPPCPQPWSLLLLLKWALQVLSFFCWTVFSVRCWVWGVCVCFLYYIMQDTDTWGKSSSFTDSSESYFHVTWLGEFVHCYVAADWVTVLKSLLQV